MFGETLLESAPSNRKRRSWPLVTAFTLELLVGSALISLPLLSSGVIPISAHTPPTVVHLDRPQIIHRDPGPTPAGGPSPHLSEPEVVPLATGARTPCFVHCPQSTDNKDTEVGPSDFKSGGHELPTALACCAASRPSRSAPVPLSNLTPGSLLHRVEPIYPRIARLSGTHGVVRLHAIIATDGTIESLSVIEGHPVLVEAAREAVKQWRYRPYILNGQPVEVETIIAVNFTLKN